jgi:ribosomal-protein-alanine N-acetyltransferase
VRHLNTEFVIRPMVLDDLPTVLAIDRMSFPTPWSERSYRFELERNPTSRLFVAESIGHEEPAIVGFVGYWLIVDEVHISTIAVHPDFRRMGIGEKMLLKALDQAIRSGASLATLEVRVTNQAAVDLYHKHGFQIVGRRSRYYRDNNEDALLMTLTNLRERLRTKSGGGR